MYYQGEQYYCPLCNKQMGFIGNGIKRFACRLCDVTYYVSDAYLNKIIGSNLPKSLYKDGKFIHNGTFIECCKYLKLIVFK